jgi:serine phosphatase RsbU (regulator of sigma subunit)
MEYEGAEAVIEEGQSVVLTSDGITEAHNADRVMFGFDRTRDIVASAPSGGGLQTLLLGQRSFAGEVEQEDDITLIALNRLNTEASPSG